QVHHPEVIPMAAARQGPNVWWGMLGLLHLKYHKLAAWMHNRLSHVSSWQARVVTGQALLSCSIGMDAEKVPIAVFPLEVIVDPLAILRPVHAPTVCQHAHVFNPIARGNAWFFAQGSSCGQHQYQRQ